MIEPVREVSLPYPCDSIKKFGREKHKVRSQELQEFRSCRMRAGLPAWAPDPRTPATPELLQLLTPDLGVFESVEVLPSKR